MVPPSPVATVQSLASTPTRAVDSGFLVPEGVEMIVGVVPDPVFGPVIACGAGGTAVELMKDVAVRHARIWNATDADSDGAPVLCLPAIGNDAAWRRD